MAAFAIRGARRAPASARLQGDRLGLRPRLRADGPTISRPILRAASAADNRRTHPRHQHNDSSSSTRTIHRRLYQATAVWRRPSPKTPGVRRTRPSPGIPVRWQATPGRFSFAMTITQPPRIVSPGERAVYYRDREIIGFDTITVGPIGFCKHLAQRFRKVSHRAPMVLPTHSTSHTGRRQPKLL